MRGHHMMGQMLCCSGAPSEERASFHPTQAVSCLSLLHVRGLPEGPSGQNRLHALNTMVDLTGTEQVCPLPMIRLHVPVSILLHA